MFPMSSATWNEIVKLWKFPPRHADVVELVLQDQPDNTIARELGISVATVRTYLNRVFQKSGVQKRLSLTLLIFADAQRIVANQE